MTRKLTYEYIKDEIEKKNLILVSDEYLNASSPLLFKCPKHLEKGILSAKWNSIQQGHGCKYCAIALNASNNRLSIEVVTEHMALRNYILLEKEYKNSQTKLKYICKLHPELEQQISWNNFKRGNGCARCGSIQRASKNKKSYEEVKSVFDEVGYSLLSDSYSGQNAPLLYKCLIHSEETQSISYGSLRAGQRCRYCTKDKLKQNKSFNHEYIKDYFDSRGLILLSKTYDSAYGKLKYICKNLPEIIQETTYVNLYSRENCCMLCRNKLFSGVNSNLWRGGVTPLHNYLRDKIGRWKQCSAKAYNYKCVITGENDFIIHHLFSFAEILKDTMTFLNMPIKESINLYTENELELISSTILEKHFVYGLGVPLSPTIHEEFHLIYGKGKNTPNQFYEFAISKGIEFKDVNLKAAVS